MIKALSKGQETVKIKLQLDYDTQTQVNELYLEEATALEIEYEWVGADDSGVWAANYEITNGKPYLYYIFSGDEKVPEDATWLVCKAKVTDRDGRVAKAVKETQIPIL